VEEEVTDWPSEENLGVLQILIISYFESSLQYLWVVIWA
jgi:hypothetical protein